MNEVNEYVNMESERKPTLLQVLCDINSHPRDKYVSIEPIEHLYSVIDPGYKGSGVISVTTWNKQHFEEFDADKIIANMKLKPTWNSSNKYWGMKDEDIKSQWTQNGKEASEAGTQMHEHIEMFMNNPALKYPYDQKTLLEYHIMSTGAGKDIYKVGGDITCPTHQWNHFLRYLQEHPHLRPYRTEWMVYHEEYNLAGSIDMVYENPDGTLVLADWKMSKCINPKGNFGKFAKTKSINHIPDCNYWKYAFQLNIYKIILEEKYNKKVTNMFLVRLHPNANSYETYYLPNLVDILKPLLNQLLN